MIKVKEFTPEVYHLPVPIFTENISVFFTDDIKKTISWALDGEGVKDKSEYIPGLGTSACVVHIEQPEYTGLWVLFDITLFKDSTVVHECIHLASRITEYRGINDEETTAYLVQWLFEQIMALWTN